MANYTQYKNLELPILTEHYDIEVFNKNNQIIDQELHNLNTKNEEQNNNIIDAQNNLNVHINNTENPHNVTKSQLGLDEVENKSSEKIRDEITRENIISALGYTPLHDYYTFLLKNQEEIVFNNNIATINDNRITKYSIADVYFTSDSISVAEKAEIYVETNDGELILTSVNIPEGSIKASIIIKNFDNEE